MEPDVRIELTGPGLQRSLLFPRYRQCLKGPAEPTQKPIVLFTGQLLQHASTLGPAVRVDGTPRKNGGHRECFPAAGLA
jgi:hypothetical protein